MEDCALIWATESNTYTCSFVYETDVTVEDLGGSYFEGAVPIVETQVAKGSPLRKPILIDSWIEACRLFEYVGYVATWME